MTFEHWELTLQPDNDNAESRDDIAPTGRPTMHRGRPDPTAWHMGLFLAIFTTCVWGEASRPRLSIPASRA
jgi:hypothetical protein